MRESVVLGRYVFFPGRRVMLLLGALIARMRVCVCFCMPVRARCAPVMQEYPGCFVTDPGLAHACTCAAVRWLFKG